jgi:hypothetical protein
MSEPTPADPGPPDGPSRDGASADRVPRPLPPEDDGGALRLKVLLAGIAALFVAILVIVAVLVATRERTVPRGANPPPALADGAAA